MKWYVVHTKPRQEFRAQENLKNQGYEVFLPTCLEEKIIKRKSQYLVVPLFARYLFVQLNHQNDNFSIIRSTRGVIQLLRFGVGSEPVTVTPRIIDDLRQRVNEQMPLRSLFKKGDTIQIKEGVFQGVKGQYQKMLTSNSGDVRALLLIEILGKQQRLTVELHQIE